MLTDGQSVLLDTGTTTLELARALASRRSMTVVTTSLAAASVLQFTPAVRTILLGGFLRVGQPDLWGPITDGNLDGLHVDRAFLGADAVGPDGSLYCSDLNVARLASRMARTGDAAYVLADSSKFGHKSLGRYGGPGDVDGLITDDGITREQRDALAQAGMHVIVAGAGGPAA